MKRFFLLPLWALASASTVLALTNLNATVSFDEEDDLRSNFVLVDDAFAQSPTGGLGGGCLEPRMFTSRGRTGARYRYTFTASPGATMVVSADFLFDASLVNTNGLERPLAFYLSPSFDSVHRILACVENPVRTFLLTQWCSVPPKGGAHFPHLLCRKGVFALSALSALPVNWFPFFVDFGLQDLLLSFELSAQGVECRLTDSGFLRRLCQPVLRA